MAEASAGRIRVEVAYATPERQWLIRLDVAEGTTIAEAIELSGIAEQAPDLEIDPKQVGIFSQKKPMDTVLRERDRVEIYRPLIADPKEVRRQRAKK